MKKAILSYFSVSHLEEGVWKGPAMGVMIVNNEAI